MGIFGNVVTYEEVITALRKRIEEEFDAGGEYTRLAEVGESIMKEHVPDSKKVGDPCPKCEKDTFPCEIITDYVAHPD
ncbi:hypothetical protein [Granulicoccus sp. GXG6511]|uniref:hypothetical protein n=1 Tax=Granulicoccus sp. GXG6511 TaxID=3381351 RepID=UPI003D7EA0A0